MTDFSRNQLSSARLKSKNVDRWVIPNDRQLALRAKLGAGWSVRTNRSESFTYRNEHLHSLTEDEIHHIQRVVSKAASLDDVEKDRIGYLVNHYERLKERCHGDGVACCFLCGTEFNRFRSQGQICSDCQHGVCPECYLETTNSMKEKLILCKICSERRELWKRSGAWFFGDIPPHTAITGSTPRSHRQSTDKATRPLTPEHSTADQPKYSSLPPRIRPPSPNIDEADITQTLDAKKTVYKTSLYLDSDDSESSSEASYDYDQSSFKKVDMDALSLNSSYLSVNPLLTQIKHSRDSLSSIPTDEPETSATESQRDMQLFSLPITTEDFQVTKQNKTKPRIEVKFHPDTVSKSSGDTDCMTPSFAGPMTPEMARCISIPNADLDQVQYYIEEDKDSPYGSIAFTMFYHELDHKLDIELLSAQHFPDKDSLYNAYISVKLTPSLGNSRKQQTATEYNSNAPKWKQKLTYFGVSMDELLYKSLVFSAMDEHLIGSDLLIGEFRLPLRQLKSYELTHYHVYLEKKVSSSSDEAVTGDERGKLLLSIRYNTAASQLHVAVIRCAALNIPNNDGLADPYVKLYLQPDYSKTSKRKTITLKRTLNPEFHEEFVYKLEKPLLEKRSLEITVWDHNVTRNVFLGGVCLSLASNVLSEKTQWSNVISQPDRRHDCWHTLRDIITK